MRNSAIAALVALPIIAPVSAYAGWFSEEMPPANAKPLSEIIKTVEDRGYKNIEEVEFNDGAWDIEVHQASGREVEIHVDPVAGKILKVE
jgi:hypothetical protein